MVMLEWDQTYLFAQGAVEETIAEEKRLRSKLREACQTGMNTLNLQRASGGVG